MEGKKVIKDELFTNDLVEDIGKLVELCKKTHLGT